MTEPEERTVVQPLWSDPSRDRFDRHPGETADEYHHRMLEQTRRDLKTAKEAR